MRYFITGATGFIGGKVAHRLLEAGHEVVALVRTPAKAQALAEAGVILAEGDITDKDSLRQPMRGVDGVFHMAAWYEVGVKNERAEQINVAGTRNVLEIMREHGIAQGVYTSTLAVFGNTDGEIPDESHYHDPKQKPFLNEYDRTKWQAHYEVALPMMREGLPLVIVQPGLVYGPGDHSAVHENLRRYLQRKLPMLPEKTAFCWAHVDDIAHAHLLAMQKGQPGESYIIAGEVKTFVEAMQLVEELTGIPAPKMRAAPGVLKALAGLMGGLNAIVPLQGQYHPESLRTIAGVTYLGDNSKARRELGYEPRSLREGLPETLAAEMQALGMPLPEKLR